MGTARGTAKAAEAVARYADMFSAMGTEPRLRIMQLLLTAHPQGLVVGVRREGTFLWYSANTGALQELVGFLYAECCTRNKAIKPNQFAACCQDLRIRS
jgi:hypothetical protein